MIAHGKSIKIFSANSNVELAREIAKYGVPMGSAEVTKFSDGEISMNIYETVRGSMSLWSSPHVHLSIPILWNCLL